MKPSHRTALILSSILALPTLAVLSAAAGPRASDTSRSISRKTSDPASWDAFLLFILRLLHEIYSGTANGISGDDLNAGLVTVSDEIKNGSPVTSLSQQQIQYGLDAVSDLHDLLTDTPYPDGDIDSGAAAGLLAQLSKAHSDLQSLLTSRGR